jgi:tetratricopeptide (TPR) repeat protein
MGAIYQKQGKIEAALPCFKEAIQAASNSQSMLPVASFWNDLGTAYFVAGDNAAALKSHQEALQANAERDTEHTVVGLMGSAAAHYKLGNHGKAAQAYLRSLELIQCRPDANEPTTVGVYIGLGKSYHQLGRLEVAIQFLELAANTAETIHETPMLVEACLCLAGCHLSLHQPDLAWGAYQRACDLITEGSDHGSLHRAYCGLSLCYLAASEPASSLLMMKKALEVSKDLAPDSRASPLLHGDEQLPSLLHACIVHHSSHLDSVLVHLWGLLAVVLSASSARGWSSHVISTSTPTAIPSETVDTALDAIAAAPPPEATETKLVGHVHRYALHTLHLLATHSRLTDAVLVAPSVDAILKLMTAAEPEVQTLAVATRVLKGFLVHRPGLSALVLVSPQFAPLLETLPTKHRSKDPESLKPVLLRLSVVAAVAETQRTLHGEGTSPRRHRHIADTVLMTAKAVALVCRSFFPLDSLSDTEARALRVSVKALSDLVPHGPAVRPVVRSILSPCLENPSIGTPTAAAASVAYAVSELQKLVGDTFTSRSLALLYPDGQCEEPPTNTSTHEDPDTTTFESFSSNSSFSLSPMTRQRSSVAIAIQRLTTDDEPATTSGDPV